MTWQEISAANDCYFEEAAKGWFWKSEKIWKESQASDRNKHKMYQNLSRRVWLASWVWKDYVKSANDTVFKAEVLICLVWSFSVDLIILMGLVSAPPFISQVHEAFRDVSININRIPSKNAVSAPLQHETGYAVLCFAEDDWPIQVVEGLVGKCQRIFTAASTLSPSCRMISVFTFTVPYHSINEYFWRFWVTRDWSN